MGKQGPCYHCGVTSTPLWRNGPPEKPVLCNACGSRWRTKGTLVNYTPLHSRAEPDDFVEYKIPKVKLISLKNKEPKLLKRKQNHEPVIVFGDTRNYDQNYRRSLDEDSNRSSSGSAISYSESCARYGGADASELTGSAQSTVWDTLVPSRKRTCFTRTKASSVEKLTKDLYSILHEQQSSYFSGSSEDDLLFDDEAPMVSVEIGHGSILMKHPNPVVREEESEASSFTIDNKSYTLNDVYSGSTSCPVSNDSVKMQNGGMEVIKKSMGQGTQLGYRKRDKYQELFQVLQNPKSPLRSIDLKDVVCFEEFVNHFTHEEQLQLMKYLPPVDTVRLPDSLESMFDSLLFEENLSSFQKLISEGVFDPSSKVDADDSKTLKKLVLMNLTKSNWIEQYNIIKDVKLKEMTGEKESAKGSKMSHVKRPRDGESQQVLQTMMRSPKRVVTKVSYDTKDLIDHESSCFSPRSLFAFTPDKSSLMLDYMQYNDDSSDQGLLLDVPSNGSFAQAELLYPTSSYGSQQASTSSSMIYHPHLA